MSFTTVNVQLNAAIAILVLGWVIFAIGISLNEPATVCTFGFILATISLPVASLHL